MKKTTLLVLFLFIIVNLSFSASTPRGTNVDITSPSAPWGDATILYYTNIYGSSDF